MARHRVGLIFVGVMCAFMISLMWAKVSPRAHRIMSRARGHVRRDPQLSRLIRNVEAEAWEAEFKVRDRTVEILIDGKEEPNPALVARARELVADFDNFERRLLRTISRRRPEGVGLRDSGIGCRHQRAASLFDQSAIGQPVPVDFKGRT